MKNFFLIRWISPRLLCWICPKFGRGKRYWACSVYVDRVKDWLWQSAEQKLDKISWNNKFKSRPTSMSQSCTLVKKCLLIKTTQSCDDTQKKNYFEIIFVWNKSLPAKEKVIDLKWDISLKYVYILIILTKFLHIRTYCFGLFTFSCHTTHISFLYLRKWTRPKKSKY